MVQNTSRLNHKEVFCTVSQSHSVNAADRAAALFRQHGGIMRMSQVIGGGITRNTLYAMRETGQVEQLARGLYRLAEMPPLSLISALSFHELTTQIPHEVWIAIPRNSEPPRLTYPPVRVSRLNEAAYRTGIETHHTDGVAIRVYSREKTLVDCFSRRKEVGLDVAIEAIKSYLSQGNVRVDVLMGYAKMLRVAKAMRPYLEALL
jgi:predicted transcriptional regulator of viral defense system